MHQEKRRRMEENQGLDDEIFGLQFTGNFTPDQLHPFCLRTRVVDVTREGQRVPGHRPVNRPLGQELGGRCSRLTLTARGDDGT